MADPTAGQAARPQPAKWDEIVAAARLHFMDEGYTATSVSALAQELRCSKSTIWGFFPTKSCLLHAVIKDLAAEWSGVFERAYAKALNCDDALTAYCGEVSSFLGTAESRKALRMLIAMCEWPDNPVGVFQTTALRTITEHLSALMADPDQIVRLFAGPSLCSLLAPAVQPARDLQGS